MIDQQKFKHLNLQLYYIQTFIFTLFVDMYDRIFMFQEMEIKKMASQGNNDGCKILAKQLVQMRKQKNRLYSANSKVNILLYHACLNLIILCILNLYM